MALPTIDEFLANLNQMRRDGIRLSKECTASGAHAAARTLDKQVRQIEGMILKKGGIVEA